MERLLVRALSLSLIAFLAVVVAHDVTVDARVALVVALLAVALVMPSWLARRRMRRLLRSGDVRGVLMTWQASLRRVTHPETMAPLLTATAYAAYGFMDAARYALARAARGPAWDAAVEQRLFVEALLDVYEGERERAVRRADELSNLPLPASGFLLKRKVARLREGVGAMARAFAHTPAHDDERVLRRAASSSPLVHWAMRYGRAVLLVDAGRAQEAREILDGAPRWPEESAFRAFDDELRERLSPHASEAT